MNLLIFKLDKDNNEFWNCDHLTLFFKEVESGNFPLLKFGLRSRVPLEILPYYLIRGSRIAELKYFHKHFPDILNNGDSYLNFAAENYSKQIFPWLFSLFPGIQVTENLWRFAVKSQNIEFLEWLLLKTEISSVFNDTSILASAAMTGSLKTVKWLRACQKPFLWSHSTFYQAVNSASLNLVKWLAENDVPYEKSDFCCLLAIKNCDLKTLKYLVEILEFPISQNCFSEARFLRYRELFNYLSDLKEKIFRF